jgi:hypothetical protein
MLDADDRAKIIASFKDLLFESTNLAQERLVKILDGKAKVNYFR